MIIINIYQVLKDVNVDLHFQNENLKLMNSTFINEIKANEAGNAYVILAKHPEYRIITFSTTDSFLKFKAREVSTDGRPKGAEYDDEYQLEEVYIASIKNC